MKWQYLLMLRSSHNGYLHILGHYYEENGLTQGIKKFKDPGQQPPDDSFVVLKRDNYEHIQHYLANNPCMLKEQLEEERAANRALKEELSLLKRGKA